MNRKVEIEQQPNKNNRRYPQYKVVGYLREEGGEGLHGWVGQVLTHTVIPFGSDSSETLMTKAEAMEVASEWFKISDESVRDWVYQR